MNAPARPPAPPPRTADTIVVPRPILFMMIGLVLFTVLSVGVARGTGLGVTREQPAAAGRAVSFTTGAVAEGPIVARLADGRRITLAGAHQDIFPRMILQGITTIRHNDGVPADTPLQLVVAADGQRLLVDPASHHTVRLAAFGPENGLSFDALLPGSAR